MTRQPGRDWQALTSIELRERVTSDTVALLPMGAIEQHGGHLPLSTDHDIAAGLAAAARRRLADDFPLLVLPAMAVGASDEHLSFPGTLSLPAEVAIAVIEAHGDALARAGVRRLVLFNAHGGNKGVMEIAALRLRRRWGMLVVKAHYMRFAPPEGLLPDAEWRHGLHGGALETSLMLALAPASVRRECLAHTASRGEAMAADGGRLGPEGEAAFAWLAEDLHPGGVVGNARLASPELGERLVAHYAARLAAVLGDTRAMAIDDFQARPDSR
ncbi:creatininase family protein [Modicisalibacter tunisiensis]|uniref:creatininase family protein n=1 Tax=Modicisalibacter tunisiensis TaxID=390637 RepID=UPI001CCA2693|nr:creatininase family protein [Modicisalibacter tunisiensis]MBZ9537631.1 creatininase family protein [Modicisalibacter tunisiensis]